MENFVLLLCLEYSTIRSITVNDMKIIFNSSINENFLDDDPVIISITNLYYSSLNKVVPIFLPHFIVYSEDHCFMFQQRLCYTFIFPTVILIYLPDKHILAAVFIQIVSNMMTNGYYAVLFLLVVSTSTSKPFERSNGCGYEVRLPLS